MKLKYPENARAGETFLPVALLPLGADRGADDSPHHAGSGDSMPASPGLPAPVGKRVELPFRILGHDRHVAMVGGVTFSCARETVTTDAGITHLWSAFKDRVLLHAACRTLNEAKNVCRGAAQGEHRPDAALR